MLGQTICSFHREGNWGWGGVDYTGSNCGGPELKTGILVLAPRCTQGPHRPSTCPVSELVWSDGCVVSLDSRFWS